MSYHRLLGRALLAATVVSVAATGCSSDGSEGGGDAIRVGVGVDSSFAPFFLAAEEGMFEDAGLDVELVQFARGGEAVQALASGDVQMAANSDGSTVNLLQQNPDLRFQYIFAESGSYIKVVARDGITDASQIEKVGFVPGVSQYGALRYLESQGVDPGAIEFVQSDPPTMPALLDKGTIDAFVLWEPWPTRSLDLNGSILADAGSFDFKFREFMVANQDWLDDNKDVAVAFAEVLSDAVDKVAEDPEAAADATEAVASIPSEQAAQGIDEIEWEVRAFNDADLASFDDIAEVYAEIGATSSKVDVATATLNDWYTTNVGS